MCSNKQLYKILFNNNLCDNKTHSKHILNDERIDSTIFLIEETITMYYHLHFVNK